MQIHVKSVEKGHPLAALKAAGSSLASPLLFTANPSMLQPYPAPQGAQAPLQAFPQSQNLGGYNAAGKHAPEGYTGYSPRDCRGLDSIGQALSAALQVCCLKSCFVLRARSHSQGQRTKSLNWHSWGPDLYHKSV